MTALSKKPKHGQGSAELRLVALGGIPEVKAGDNLVNIVLASLAHSQEELRSGDVIVVAQKIVSKAQGRSITLSTVQPSTEAITLAREVNKDPQIVELILRESSEVVASRKDVLIVAHRSGFVMANAGIDLSNVDHSGGETALLLPEDPDGTCARLRAEIKEITGIDVAVVINDSHGRPFRNGTVGVAVGVSGMPGLLDLRGKPDRHKRTLTSTEVGVADEVASAASLLMGQADEGRPIVVVRGVPIKRANGTSAELIRRKELDLFRAPTAANVLKSRRSVRRYTNQDISRKQLEALIEAAMHAPSAHNRQPWRFVAIPARESRARLARTMAEQLCADRASDGDAHAAIEADANRSVDRITNAPMVVVACLTMADMDAYPDERRSAAERVMAIQGTAMAIQNLLLAATVQGLGSSIMCAPLFCPEAVRTELSLPADWEPQALITLGYASHSSKKRERLPLHNILRIVGEFS